MTYHMQDMKDPPPRYVVQTRDEFAWGCAAIFSVGVIIGMLIALMSIEVRALCGVMG